MFLSSIVLYFGDNPVGYDLFKEDEGFSFRQAIDSQLSVEPAIIKVSKSEAGWTILHTLDLELHEQIIKIIDIHEAMELPGGLSVAS